MPGASQGDRVKRPRDWNIPTRWEKLRAERGAFEREREQETTAAAEAWLASVPAAERDELREVLYAPDPAQKEWLPIKLERIEASESPEERAFYEAATAPAPLHFEDVATKDIPLFLAGLEALRGFHAAFVVPVRERLAGMVRARRIAATRLTRKQRMVLELVAARVPRPEIAARLKVSAEGLRLIIRRARARIETKPA
jgi:DNA-binding CsgD family transcriptional regulator